MLTAFKKEVRIESVEARRAAARKLLTLASLLTSSLSHPASTMWHHVRYPSSGTARSWGASVSHAGMFGDCRHWPVYWGPVSPLCPTAFWSATCHGLLSGDPLPMEFLQVVCFIFQAYSGRYTCFSRPSTIIFGCALSLSLIYFDVMVFDIMLCQYTF